MNLKNAEDFVKIKKPINMRLKSEKPNFSHPKKS